ncbi:beta-aspartyl-peptidase (threonine type) [Herbaspirillum sp. Sphag1AN]|uniref:isoaspartyl peptidase/L-asparaginase family protein n=1 Tax=unclassified Herbaspirillum TaxID=2624150 RepID=UPI00161EC907|nr:MULTISPECIES: isoaspartyl peptidase/L-asparaginase [unclassified Herbaspirillum]MBB3211723.1 beta-aspartyl-peptidase (threonine type) [Herbaspirillum sp. Sphag1AN]MBB3245009.1 beta-aspartyl-peptidase (threonine type) [Herbaspirillum sp. Sphag64]
MTLPLIAIHGGAGTITRADLSAADEKKYHAALQEILVAAQTILTKGGSALDAVTEAVRLLEDCPLFNAGKGSVYTRSGTHELDAAIMDGATLGAGAVANVTTIRNPIVAARAVMTHSAHVLLAGSGAETFAREQGLAPVTPDYFHTEARYAQWQRVLAQGNGQAGALDHDGAALIFRESAHQAASAAPVEPIDPDSKFGTVGAVALDRHGNLAAATSTGGMTNKQVGRVGDTPLIGAGCYAANATAAVSTTGTGEVFMRTVAAYDVAARMAYAGASLEQAAEQVVMQLLPAYEGRGGLIAVDAQGNLALPFNTEGMYRGYARGSDTPVTAIYR